MSIEKKLEIGKYRHYKNKKEYLVIGIGKHTETLEDLIVYKALYDSEEFGKDSIWIRPLSMFLEDVEVEGKKVPRFEFIGE